MAKKIEINSLVSDKPIWMFRNPPWLDILGILCTTLSCLIKDFGAFLVGHELTELLDFFIRSIGRLRELPEEDLS
jgi:hypothetical protein